MPRKVDTDKMQDAIHYMLDLNMSQREISQRTGLSRPYLRKLAKQLGYQFPRNGLEVVGQICMCANCGSLMRKSPSKIKRVENNFCDITCRTAYFTGPNHPFWKEGKTAKSFSSWITNQADYKVFREEVLKRDGFKCVVSGQSDNLQVHHLLPKSEEYYPEKALDPSNGITLNSNIHIEIHKLIRSGVDFYDAVDHLRQKYGEQS